MITEAEIVIGLGFGDEGKGKFTSYLCQYAQNPLVIRFSGGQQAGHTVIYRGKKHVFSNYGSGTLQGVPTYFSEHCSIYLNTMVREKEVLENKLNISPVLNVHPLTKITTPYDVVFGRLRESKLKHGSCGLGIGTTMARHDNSGYKLHAVDTSNTKVFKQKLMAIKNYYIGFAKQLEAEEEFLQLVAQPEKLFLEACTEDLFGIQDYDQATSKIDTVIFEGSQGILLDKDFGFFPNVTYSNTTSKNAMEICEKLELFPNIHYITRCYQTRHGNGWMSNEQPLKLINTEAEINTHNEWQGNFRIGEIDYDLLTYAIDVDMAQHQGAAETSLVITCLDQRPGFNFDYNRVGYNFDNIFESNSPETLELDRIEQ